MPIDGAANVFCDNRGVVKNASIPESTLQKKHNAINYHAVQEVALAGILRVGKEDGQTNLADMLTKVLTGQRRWGTCVGTCFGSPLPRCCCLWLVAHTATSQQVDWKSVANWVCAFYLHRRMFQVFESRTGFLVLRQFAGTE